jgi:ABC-type branched-subunit amino acid transport system substrate-binding protein
MDRRKKAMAPPPDEMPAPQGKTRRAALGLILGGPLVGAPLLAGCTTGLSPDIFSSSPQATGPQQQPSAIGSGQIKVGLLLPMSAAGNAGAAAQSMKNAAEMALAEFQNPNVQLLVKDDNGTAQGAQQGAQQALDEGAEIMLGPLFAQSVPAAAQLVRNRNVPMIAFSTDSTVAGRGVFLLSFLPESDVNRIVDYSASIGKRSFAAMIPDNAYGSVVEAAFRQAVPRRGGRIVALERYTNDRARIQQAAQTVAQALPGADALFLPDDGDALPPVVDALSAVGADVRRVQLLGTGLWDSPRVFSNASLQGGMFAAPDPVGFRAFAGRYRSRFGSDPVRTATLSYDAVALVAALARTQGAQRFAQDVLTNPSGFAGIDGLFRFRGDGSNERGLAVMKVAPGGAQIVSPPPKSFGV